MIAAPERAATAPELSDKAKGLMAYVRGHKSIFRPGTGFNSITATLFRKNDTGRMLTPLEELATNAHVLPGGSVAAMILVQESEIIKRSADEMIADIGEEHREMVEYDVGYMLRVISYGIASGSSDFVHDNNWGMLKMLHREVGIDGSVDVKGVEKMRETVLGEVKEEGIIGIVNACFDRAVELMS